MVTLRQRECASGKKETLIFNLSKCETRAFLTSFTHLFYSLLLFEAVFIFSYQNSEFHAYVVLIEFNVTSVRGDVTVYKANSIEELRVRVAMQTGLLSPCIQLFKRSDNRMIEDTYRVGQEFDDAQEPLTDLHAVNILEQAKQEVGDWTSEKWIRVSKQHLWYGDQNIVEHAGSLISADERFHGKMREWKEKMIDDIWFYSAEEVKAAIAIGVDMSGAGKSGQTLLHAAAELGRVAIIHTLLTVGARDLNMRDKFGNTPLYLAAYKEQLEVVKALLNARADSSLVNNNGISPFQAAAYGGLRPLNMAALNIYAERNRILTGAGANVDGEEENEMAPYDVADNQEYKKALHGLLYDTQLVDDDSTNSHR